MKLAVAPISISDAKRYVRQWHRHLPAMTGGLFAAGLSVDGEIRGVAVAGRGPRVWEGTGRIVITRVAIDDGIKNGCTKLYGAICRAAEALGWREAWTYTLPSEPGTSLLAAGFEDMGQTGSGDWNRPSRKRESAIKEPKRRWRRKLSPR